MCAEFPLSPSYLGPFTCAEVTQIAFKPDWAADGKAAPFKRNDRMIEIVPVGVIIFPGSGITGNLADKTKKLGIPVLDHRQGGA